jgi:putative thiamine transport system permease protein
MARTLRGLRLTAKALSGFILLCLLWVLPLFAGLLAIVFSTYNPAGWRALFAHPQLWSAVIVSLTTGTAGLIIATMLAFWIAAGLFGSPAWKKLQGLMGGFLSLPHLAFAIGFGFLIMPSGLLARGIGVNFGWTSPPHWITTQDPLGVSLAAALVLKEIPFVLWLIVSLLARTDFAQRLNGQARAATGLGHGPGSIWLRVFIPQILPRLVWPLLIVWVYGCSVVDMAIAIGPPQPPPLAVIIWTDLNNVDVTINARGTAGAVFLTLLLAGIAVFAWALSRALNLTLRWFYAGGPSTLGVPRTSATVILIAIAALYGLVLILLSVMSVGSYWPFPALVPMQFRTVAWLQLITSPGPLLSSLGLALASVSVSIGLAIAWLESFPERFDGYVLGFAVAALALPSLLIAEGQYLAFLHLHLNGTWFGVFLGQLTPVFAYVFIVLKGPYRAFDRRYRSISYGLNISGIGFWARIKMPLLKPVVASATAVGVGVSVAQFVPVQLIAAGRFSTLTTEAVTLSSGGSRQLLAVFSLVLMVIPLLAFGAASLVRKPVT